MPGIPGETRRTRYGHAVRSREGWTWTCQFCERQSTLGLGPDEQLFDTGRWLEAIDAAHRCAHKPDEQEAG